MDFAVPVQEKSIFPTIVFYFFHPQHACTGTKHKAKIATYNVPRSFRAISLAYKPHTVQLWLRCVLNAQLAFQVQLASRFLTAQREFNFQACQKQASILLIFVKIYFSQKFQKFITKCLFRLILTEYFVVIVKKSLYTCKK